MAKANGLSTHLLDFEFLLSLDERIPTTQETAQSLASKIVGNDTSQNINALSDLLQNILH
jgi:hypothetical protein